MGRCEDVECTQSCRSRQHGSQITAAIIRGTETQAIAYMKNLCQRCHSVTDATGKTALHTAASCGKRKIVKWLLSQGASLNQRDWESGYTPLHRALFYGHLGTACTLIQAGSSTSTLDNDALTPLDHINFDRARSMSFTSSQPTQVYLWGNNTNFNLGQTSQHARGTPECLDIFHREGHKISDVVLNKFHTLFLTTSGRVYTCGHGQGGRLGLDTNAPVITPRPIKVFTHTNVIRITSGTHHSLFLTDAGQVLSCGSNIYHQLGLNPPPEYVYTPKLLTWHKDHKDTVITGIEAAKYHSVIWTPRALYTFGLNAGQLGHFRNTNESTIVTPRNVTSVVLKEDGNLTCVGVSDGATVLSTSHGAIYVLHQYQIRKVASKMLGVVKVGCVGGHLDSKVGAKGLIEHGGDDLKIAVLVGGEARSLYIWTEQSSHLSRCTFNINREICIVDFCMSSQCLGIVTESGEAFSGVISPSRTQRGNEKPPMRKSLWTSGHSTDTYYTTSCIALRLSRIPALHRTFSIMCDPKGLNFAALQNEPVSFLSNLPQVSSSTFSENFKTFLQNTYETDTVHDVVVICGKQRFPAHSYILATHSQYFRHILLHDTNNANHVDNQNAWNIESESEVKCLMLPDVQPESFQEVLNFMYTRSYKHISFRSGISHTEKNLNNVNTSTSDSSEWESYRNLPQKSAFSITNKEVEDTKASEKSRKRKGKNSLGPSNLLLATLSLARKLEIKTLEEALMNYKRMEGSEEEMYFDFMECGETFFYCRENLPELWDVTVTSKTGDAIRAHKCILAARLEYFNIMFGSRWNETVASESISMPLPTSILTVILDYLYEDDAPRLWQCHDIEFLCNVLVVADQFLIARLQEICEKVIASLLTLKNAAELLEFAAGHNAVGLKTTIMQFLCQNLVAVLENGTLLSSLSQERLQELSEYYRSINECMSYRIMTPHDAPPYTKDLQHTLDENPFILQESDEEMEGTFLLKDEKALMGGGTPGSSRKKKRQHRNSQGDGRHRKPSTSSSVCSSDYDQKELDEEFENMNFDDLEERKQSPVVECVEVETNKEETNNLTGNVIKDRDKDISHSEADSWQKVTKKKSTSSQPIIMSTNSPVQSPGKENTCLDIFQSAGITRQSSQYSNTYLNRLEESSLPKFPSLQESISTAQRTIHAIKSSKIQKLSQKQRKRLISETTSTPPPDKLKVPSCPWGLSTLAWGKEKDTEDCSSDTSNLANIMMSEMTKVNKKNSIPYSIPDKKSLSDSIAQNKNGVTPNNGYKDLESVAWSAVTPSSTINSSPIHNNGLSTGKATNSDFAAPSFTHILMEEETRSDNLLRERSKPLSLIQVEDRAIEELLAFYGAGECFEERITVTRVSRSIANPTWSK